MPRSRSISIVSEDVVIIATPNQSDHAEIARNPTSGIPSGLSAVTMSPRRIIHGARTA